MAATTGVGRRDRRAMGEHASTAAGAPAGPVRPGGEVNAALAGPEQRSTGTGVQPGADSHTSTGSCGPPAARLVVAFHGPQPCPTRYRLLGPATPGLRPAAAVGPAFPSLASIPTAISVAVDERPAPLGGGPGRPAQQDTPPEP